MENKQWAGTTFGNGFLLESLRFALRFIDVRLVYLFSYIFVIPVVLLLNPSRKTSWSFYRERMGFGRLKSAWYVYKNHCMFSQVVVDRFAMYAGKKFDVVVEGMEKFDALAAADKAFVMLSSHIGNYEIAGYSFVSASKTINAVVYGYEKQAVMDNRNSMFSKTNVKMIGIREDMSHLFEIDHALADGNIVSFPADRYMGDIKTLSHVFLGKEARFPMGPFSVAAMRGLDVLAVNTMKSGPKSYRIYVTPLEYDKGARRKEQLSQLSAAYVAELEKRVKQYPAQWYNFFDFWQA